MGSEVTVRFRSYSLHLVSCTFGVHLATHSKERCKTFNAEFSEQVYPCWFPLLLWVVPTQQDRTKELRDVVKYNTNRPQPPEKVQCWWLHLFHRHTWVLYRKPFVCCHQKSKALKVSFSPENIDLTPKDLRWVGAWWLGFLVASCLIFITALPYFFFPRNMPDQVRTKNLTERARIYNSNQSSFKHTFLMTRDAVSLLLRPNHLYAKIFKHFNCFLLSET